MVPGTQAASEIAGRALSSLKAFVLGGRNPGKIPVIRAERNGKGEEPPRANEPAVSVGSPSAERGRRRKLQLPESLEDLKTLTVSLGPFRGLGGHKRAYEVSGQPGKTIKLYAQHPGRARSYYKTVKTTVERQSRLPPSVRLTRILDVGLWMEPNSLAPILATIEESAVGKRIDRILESTDALSTLASISQKHYDDLLFDIVAMNQNRIFPDLDASNIFHHPDAQFTFVDTDLKPHRNYAYKNSQSSIEALLDALAGDRLHRATQLSKKEMSSLQLLIDKLRRAGADFQSNPEAAIRRKIPGLRF
jgi:hypothetical protein